MTGPNWGALYAQGRCKDIGVPWNEEETAALAAGIPVLYVRSGVTTKAAYAKAQKEDESKGTPPERMERGELVKLAGELGVEFTPDIPTSVLVTAVAQALGKGKKVGGRKTTKKVGAAPAKRVRKAKGKETK